MEILKKTLLIGSGLTFIILGVGACFVFTTITNVELNSKILGIVGGIASIIIGWWLLRRGSSSVPDTLGWILQLFIF